MNDIGALNTVMLFYIVSALIAIAIILLAILANKSQ